MTPETVFEIVRGYGWPIKLERTKRSEDREDPSDRFCLTYGKQVTCGLTYTQAAQELGAAIMHACACEGKLD